MYIADGGADMAVPPLKALLHIMAKGEYEGMTLESPEFRAMWKRENIIKSDWYKQRLQCFQVRLVAALPSFDRQARQPAYPVCAGLWCSAARRPPPMMGPGERSAAGGRRGPG